MHDREIKKVRSMTSLSVCKSKAELMLIVLKGCIQELKENIKHLELESNSSRTQGAKQRAIFTSLPKAP